MKNYKNYISLFFAVTIAFGVTVSAVHVHFDDFQDVETEHALSEEELNCVICGSIFKFNSESENIAHYQEVPDTFYFFSITERANSPFGKFKDGRAPPFFG